MASQKWLHHQRYLCQQKYCRCYLTLSEKKHDVWKFRDCIKANSEKRDTENKQKFAFLLILAKKDSLCSGIQTYFLRISEVLAIYFHWQQNHIDFN